VRIFLTGFMGSGKSTVGRRLAARSGAAFVDLDRAIEEASGRSVPELFAATGEAEFRDLEARALRATAALEDAVVATGGGVPLDPANRSWMRRRGTVVWLDVPAPVLMERLAAAPGQRPLLASPGATLELLTRRLSAYADCDVRLGLEGGETPDEVVERLLRVLPDLSSSP
jgi:shikimate kinase